MRTNGVTRARIYLGAAFALLAALIWVPAAVVAQGVTNPTPSPTPEQIEAFQTLTPEQQKAVLEAASGGAGGATRRDPQLATPSVSVPRLDTAPTSTSPPTPIELGPPRIGPRSTLLIEAIVREEVLKDTTDLLRQELITARRDRIADGNPYVLDAQGRLTLPVVAPIAMAGLTNTQAAQLLNADPRLQGMMFLVSVLPVEPVGIEALKPFGYDLFAEVPTTFATASDIPVPADYRVGPGDNITVDLFGKKSGRYQLVVDRNGALTIPEFGPIQVVGLTFDGVRQEIEQRVVDQMIGVRASVTMGQLRSIRIFVVGDVNRPGAYTVSGLSTVTNALFTSGGVSQIGSLRNIELKRGGTTVTRLDLYELFLKGNASRDVPLMQGDAIFVPPVGPTASVTGQIRRPAIYEFRDGTTVSEMIELSGGLAPDGNQRLVRIERIAAEDRTVINADLSTVQGRSQRLVSGDIITVPKVLDDTRGVMLEGLVNRPGPHAWFQGMRLTDLLGGLQAFKVDADQRYVLIRREHLPSRRLEAMSADAVAAFAAPHGPADPALKAGDRVIVFSLQPDRGPALAQILREMSLQTRDNRQQPVVSINGRVRAQGDYPLEEGMTVEDLIRAGGGMDEAAYPLTAELTRYEVINNEARQTEVIHLDLSQVSANNMGAMTPLRAHDVLVVKETPDWREQEAVTLAGEVKFPGTYPIRQGETLSSVVARAGGLTDIAFSRGSIFLRREIAAQEREQVDKLVTRMQSDLALLALQGAQVDGKGATETLAAGQSLLTQLKAAQPIGRLVIDLPTALKDTGGEEDIELRGGDRLMIPRTKQYVTVIGEVQNPTTHVYKSGRNRDDYVELSGGLTQRADDDRIYVVKANGSVVSSESPYWFRRASSAALEPGDTVVVPLDAERLRPLQLWTAVTTIVYNLAVAVAAIGSL